MHKKKLFLAFGLLTCFYLMLISRTVYLQSPMLQEKYTTQLYLTQNLQAEELAKIKNNSSDLLVTAWSQRNNETIVSVGTHKRGLVSAIALNGSSRLVFPDYPTLAEDDFFGCIIDTKTAQSILGSENAQNAELEYDGKKYIVRGVVKSPIELFIFNGGAEEEYSLLAVTGKVEEAKQFAFAYNVEYTYSISNVSYMQAGKIIVFLPLLMFLLLCSISSLLYTVLYNPTVIRIAGIVLFWMFFCIFIWILIRIFPQHLIPHHWSDFEQWHMNYSNYIKSWKNYILYPKTCLDCIWLLWIQKIMTYTAGSILLILHLFSKIFFEIKKALGSFSELQIKF